MGFLFGHYAGDRRVTEKAIETLQKFDKFFRENTPATLGRPPLLRKLPELQAELNRALPQADYRFTICDASNLNELFVFNGRYSTVDWANSMAKRCIQFQGLVPVDRATLYPFAKQKLEKLRNGR